MGLDAVEIALEIEDRFDVTFEPGDWEALGTDRFGDFSAGALHFLVGVKLREAGKPIPPSLWHGIQLVLARALNKRPLQIRPDSRLIADLGMG